MPEPAGSPAECDDTATAAEIPSNEDPNSESATPLQGRRKGFPVIPPRNKMKPMFATPKPSSREKLRARNGPPIDEWEAVLVGKKLVPEDAEDDENTFKKSDLPINTTFRPGVVIPRGCVGRLIIYLDTERVVVKLSYG